VRAMSNSHERSPKLPLNYLVIRSLHDSGTSGFFFPNLSDRLDKAL
jgi:hypothetical protein